MGKLLSSTYLTCSPDNRLRVTLKCTLQHSYSYSPLICSSVVELQAGVATTLTLSGHYCTLTRGPSQPPPPLGLFVDNNSSFGGAWHSAPLYATPHPRGQYESKPLLHSGLYSSASAERKLVEFSRFDSPLPPDPILPLPSPLPSPSFISFG